MTSSFQGIHAMNKILLFLIVVIVSSIFLILYGLEISQTSTRQPIKNKVIETEKNDVKELIEIQNSVKELDTMINKKQESLLVHKNKMFISGLRSKGNIESLPSGGERLLSFKNKLIHFPLALMKMRPENWKDSYEIYLNLTHFPWDETPTCKKFQTVFAPPGSLQTTGLASFPSSGNTWIRYLIEGASGIFTGSLYDDTSLINAGFYGEAVIFDSGMTILQKTHGYTTGDYMRLQHIDRMKFNHLKELNHRAVLVIRNPFKALISHRHLDTGGHLGHAPQLQFESEGWQLFVQLKLNLWKEFYIDWLESARPTDLHVVIYEELFIDFKSVIRNILKFLDLPIDEERLTCLYKYQDGKFKRKPSSKFPKDFNPFDHTLTASIYAAIDEVNEALVKYNKIKLPVDIYELYDMQEAEKLRSLRKQKPIESVSS